MYEDIIILQLSPREASDLELLLREVSKKKVSPALLSVLEKVYNQLKDWEEN